MSLKSLKLNINIDDVFVLYSFTLQFTMMGFTLMIEASSIIAIINAVITILQALGIIPAGLKFEIQVKK